ncbi:methyltransferase family protein [Ureibacillus xyleni]|uniref:Methyltransferase family protein n=1 Tax=Ureibacillus xyleni TaxID=614648 RepID=A0A285SXB2_9BACL|nr:class I SAM-dependent methyltransferase [Ureibacillus xyleni]SOC11106.1 methyltransferase family protein [Ureibacillus xyleni]
MKLLDKLIEQAKNPNGILGSVMLKIMNKAHIEMNRWALEKIKVQEDAVILDVGCGGGKTLQLLSKLHTTAQVYGIDYSEQAVKDSIRANQAEVEVGKIHVQQASVTNIPFLESTFDIITAFQTHYFWTDMENSVKEIFRVLKKDGSFFIISEIYKINYHMKVYKTNDEMKHLYKEVGFNTVEFYEHPNRKWICIKGIK